MNTSVIIAVVILYEIVSIGGCALYLKMKERKNKGGQAAAGDDFSTGGQSMTWPVVGASLALSLLGMIIDHAKAALTEKFIKELHLVLKNGTSDSRKDWFAVGEYKKLPNEVGGRDTALPEEVADKMKALLTEYNAKEKKTFEDILDFHVKFEQIHPFQDGNGRVGRLIMFKECLKYNIVPFIIEDDLKMFYYRGLKEWDNEKGYLTDTCLTAQDKYKAYLDYFRIAY